MESRENLLSAAIGSQRVCAAGVDLLHDAKVVDEILRSGQKGYTYSMQHRC